jgi:hypothetical protein
MEKRICAKCQRLHRNRATVCRTCAAEQRNRQEEATRQALRDEGYQAGLAQAEKLVAKERAAVVAWLNLHAKQTRDTSLAAAAICLKRAEHINASGAGVEGGGR